MSVNEIPKASTAPSADRHSDFPDSHRPSLSSDVVILEMTSEPGSSSIVVRSVTGAHVLNATAAAILSCCDGERSIGEIGALMAASYGLDRDVAVVDVRSIVRELTALAVVDP
jgi:hypothetical protein